MASLRVNTEQAVDQIAEQRALAPRERSLLVGISGIDGSGKGYVTQQLVARLALRSIAAANINVDGWLNLPEKRFNPSKPAQYFYENAIRFDELFNQLVLPLRDQRSIDLVADIAEERARSYSRHTYCFKNIDVLLLEGIFLFKRDYRKLFDLTIWVDCSFSTALARALARKQEGLPPALTIRAYDTIYFPAQRIHMEEDHPREASDLIFANDPYLGRQSYYRRDIPLMASTASHH
jgi:uridine kinase